MPPLAVSKGGFVTAEPRAPPIEAGLLERFRVAEQGIAWKPAELPPIPAHSRKPRGKTAARTRVGAGARWAYYHDETARIEQHSVGSEDVLMVTSGPVGALVLVGECARRGLPTSLEARNAGDLPEFPQGAIEARWDANARTFRYTLPFGDVVKLARYALA